MLERRCHSILLAVLLGLTACWTPVLHMPVEWEQPDENIEPSDVPDHREVRRSYFGGEQTRVSRELPVVFFTDGHMERDGLERAWYEDGSPRLEQAWKHDLRVGIGRRWSENGTLILEVDRGDGVIPAPMRFWHANGVVAGEGVGIDGVKHGHWITWHGDGTKRSEGGYVLGLRDGAWSFWDEFGILTESGEYNGGQRIGEWMLRERSVSLESELDGAGSQGGDGR